jgi:emfourin
MRRITTLAAMCSIAALVPAAPVVAAPARASTIVLERSGGFAGRQESFLVDRTTVGGERALRLAARPEFRRLRGSYQPANPCCDRFLYELTVTYRDGRHQTVSTVQGGTAPRILWDVIAEVQRVGARPVSPAPVS